MQTNNYGSGLTTLARMVSFKGAIKTPKRITQASKNQIRVPVGKRAGGCIVISCEEKMKSRMQDKARKKPDQDHSR